jgi:hypothetical protein
MKNSQQIKAVEMVRKIRDENYGLTKNMTVKQKIEFIHREATRINKKLLKQRV